MDKTKGNTFFSILDYIIANLTNNKLADVFRIVSFTKHEVYNAHRHKRIEINFVKKGSCSLLLDNSERVDFTENDIMIISSDVLHKFTAGLKGATLMQLEFLPEIFSSFQFNMVCNCPDLNLGIFSTDIKVIKIEDNVSIMRTIQRIISELNSTRVYNNYLVVIYYAELLLLIYRYLEEHYFCTITSQPLLNAIGYIKENYQKELNVKQISAVAGVGERYMRKLFSTHLNMTAIDYLNCIRINRAVELLKTTDMYVKEIAFACGFQSAHYFNRIFKKYIGVTPTKLLK